MLRHADARFHGFVRVEAEPLAGLLDDFRLAPILLVFPIFFQLDAIHQNRFEPALLIANSINRQFRIHQATHQER